MKFLSIIIFLLSVSSVFAQMPAETSQPLAEYQQDQEKLCREQTISQNRTYSFRQLPRADKDSGEYVKKSFFQKLFPFLKTPSEKYGIDDIRTLKTKFGRPAPVGISKPFRELNLKIEKNLPDLLQKAKLAKFDQRENGIEVGKVGSQGFNCNTCWAFATIDAFQINRQLLAKRENREFTQEEQPSARQLVSCMVKKPEEFCENNWHGEAFSFMVDKGLPLGGASKYKEREAKTWECDAENYVKALTWDFVSATPHKIASIEEIKKAIILYGSVVSMLSFDNCYWLYGGGVFNEERFRNGSHFVVIIGWDDEKQAWLIKNSYGEEWGEKGFGWIKYGSNNIGQWAAFIVADPKEKAELQSKK
jgi:C1A family cysteine protease